jgi:hypothetical protein
MFSSEKCLVSENIQLVIQGGLLHAEPCPLPRWSDKYGLQLETGSVDATPRHLVIDAVDAIQLHHLTLLTSTCSKTMPPREGTE